MKPEAWHFLVPVYQHGPSAAQKPHALTVQPIQSSTSQYAMHLTEGYCTARMHLIIIYCIRSFF